MPVPWQVSCTDAHQAVDKTRLTERTLDKLIGRKLGGLLDLGQAPRGVRQDYRTDAQVHLITWS